MVVAALVVAGCTSHAAEPATITAVSTQPGIKSDSGDPVPEVMQRDFRIDYQLEGVSAQSTDVPLTRPFGMEWGTHLQDGAIVAKGAPVGELRVDASFSAALIKSSATSRIDAARLATLNSQAGPVAAPIGGVVSATGAGDLAIDSPGIDVVVPLTGIQQLRLSCRSLPRRPSRR